MPCLGFDPGPVACWSRALTPLNQPNRVGVRGWLGPLTPSLPAQRCGTPMIPDPPSTAPSRNTEQGVRCVAATPSPNPLLLLQRHSQGARGKVCKKQGSLREISVLRPQGLLQERASRSSHDHWMQGLCRTNPLERRPFSVALFVFVGAVVAIWLRRCDHIVGSTAVRHTWDCATPMGRKQVNKALHTCTSWYAYATMFGSSIDKMVPRAL